MGMPDRWNKNPRPDPAVIELAASLKEAAERGEIRSLAVVVVNPMLEVEMTVAGIEDESGVRKRLLAAGLIEVSHTLLSK